MLYDFFIFLHEGIHVNCFISFFLTRSLSLNFFLFIYFLFPPPRDSDAALRDVAEERTVYAHMLEEARSAITQLQDELTDAR